MNRERYAIQLRKNSAPAVILNVDTDSYDGTDDASVTIRLQTNNGIAFSFGNSLTFYNAAYKLIVDELANSTTAQQNFIEIYIFDKCCKNADGSDYLIFKGIIRSTDIQLTIKPDSEACAVECDFTDYSPTSEAINCLKQTVIFSRNANGRTSDGENEGRQAVYFSYYEETRPKAYFYFILLLGAYLVAMATVVLNILTLGLININNTLGNIQADIAGAFVRKRFHKTPFLASYLRNACKLCGLQLQSSLFTTGGFFENVVRLDAAIQEGGIDTADADSRYSDFNAPNITAADFLDSLREFNVSYWIESGNTLVVERKDYQTVNWIDFSTRLSDINRLTLKFGDVTPPATRTYEYINDQSDKTGQERFRAICGFAIDFNTPPNPTFRGSEKVTLPFGAWRAINDGTSSVLAEISGNFLGTLYNVDEKSMIMQTGTCLSPKVLEYDTTTPLNDAKMLNLNQKFNIDATGRLAAQGWIYAQFLSLDDPRNNTLKNREFELTFIYGCEDLRTFQFNKTVRLPLQDGTFRDGTIESLTVNFQDGTATINGKI